MKNKTLFLVLGSLMTLGLLIFAKTPETTSTIFKRVADTYKIHGVQYPEAIDFAGESVPLYDADVRERLDREFLVNTYWQSNALLLIKRSEKYFPIIDSILEAHGVPSDFKYLALAESGLENVVSPAGAAGFWQIMKNTAREYGLKVNYQIDERYHLIKSTETASKYLKKWYTEFGSWTLTAAAYNVGPNGLKRRLEEQKVERYYDLLLPDETSRYIFRILAIKEIVSKPGQYGFKLVENDYYRYPETRLVELKESVTDLNELALELNTNYKWLKKLNPWLRKNSLELSEGESLFIEIPKGANQETTALSD
ncbi:MAG: lytic transglycosylase domain-containing protein [Flavobacteriaceae bacterium]